jgi:N-acyl-D-amino-acid deacylase
VLCYRSSLSSTGSIATNTNAPKPLSSPNSSYPPTIIPPPVPYPTTILIRNAKVIDGAEKPDNKRYLADVKVENGIITSIFRHPDDKIGPSNDESEDGTAKMKLAEQVLDIDATGLVLCPGFIDMHAHSDLHLLTHPSHIPKVSQGITTEVVGQDGIGYAPLIFDDTDGDGDGERQIDHQNKDGDDALEYVRYQIAGWNGNPDAPPSHYPASERSKPFFSWRTVQEYLDTLDRHIPTTNIAYLVPQGNLRLLTMGANPGKASERDIGRMKRLLRKCLDEGAIGMSSGLTYVPGMYADTEELKQLCDVLVDAVSSLNPPHLPEAQGVEKNARQYKPYYCPHTRSYGLNALGAYEEMLQLGLRSGAPIHLTHATLNFAPNTGIAPRFLELLEKYEGMGVDVTLDSYPYLPGSTTLSSMLPSWVLAGGREKTMKRLSGEGEDETISFPDGDRVLRGLAILEKVREDVCVLGSDGCHGLTVDWDIIEIAGFGTKEANVDPILSGCVGKRLSEIAREFSLPDSAVDIGSNRSQTLPETPLSTDLSDPFNLFVYILLRDSLATTILQHAGHEDNVRRVMTHHSHMMSTDAILAPTKPHPRAWGTTGRYLSFYGRDIFSVKEGTEEANETRNLRIIKHSHLALPDGDTDGGTKGSSRKGPDGLPEWPPSEQFPAPFLKEGTLEDVIPHLTSRPAARLGLLFEPLSRQLQADNDMTTATPITQVPAATRPNVPRGLIKAGYAADLVIFDPFKVRDRATFTRPNQQTEGMEWVMVNGKIAVERGRVTGVRGGRTIRRDTRTGLVW